MSDKARIAELEAVLARFMQPIKNIPFSIIVKAMAGHAVLPIDGSDPQDAALVAALTETARQAARLIVESPIRRNRPNEVGNDIEPFVLDAARRSGLDAGRPTGKSGRGKTTGYPDILLRDATGRPTYLECKIFGEGAALTTMRSFYLSPSEDFKIVCDARHLLIAFEMVRKAIPNSRDSYYVASAFKPVDLYALMCDVKYEFNSDNRRLYAAGAVLSEGRFERQGS